MFYTIFCNAKFPISDTTIKINAVVRLDSSVQTKKKRKTV